jgi:hypothetical protein
MFELTKFLAFLIILLFFIVIISIIFENTDTFIEYRRHNNGNEYGIQEKLENPDEALQLIGKLHDNMWQFTNKLSKKYPDDARVKRLVKGFKDVKIEETEENHNDDNTSFTINKGELMSLCLREPKTGRPFHDYNTLSFVFIHELAHIASITEGHNFEFIENFRFLLREAAEMGYYLPVDYSKQPFLYCGKIKVTNNPYY